MEYPKGQLQYNPTSETPVNPEILLFEAKNRLEKNLITQEILKVLGSHIEKFESVSNEEITNLPKLKKLIGSPEKVTQETKNLWEIKARRRRLRFFNLISQKRIKVYEEQSLESKDQKEQCLLLVQNERNIILKNNKEDSKLQAEEVKLSRSLKNMSESSVLINPDNSIPVWYRASHHIPDKDGVLDHIRYSGKDNTAENPLGVFIGSKNEAIYHAKARLAEETVGNSLIYSVLLNIRRPLIVGHKFWHEEEAMEAYARMKSDTSIDAVIVLRAGSNQDQAITKIMNGNFEDIIDIVVRDPKNIVPIRVELFNGK